MSDAIEKDTANSIPQQWYVKIEDGSTFGPVGVDELRAWAETGRIAPGQLISHDRQDWLFAENLPDLQMVWRIELDDGAMYGPVNLQAIRSLVDDGTVSRKAVLVNELTHQKSSVAKEIDGQTGKPAPSSRSARSSAAAQDEKPRAALSGPSRESSVVSDFDEVRTTARRPGGDKRADSDARPADTGAGPEPAAGASSRKARKPSGPPAGESRVDPVVAEASRPVRSGADPQPDKFERAYPPVSDAPDHHEGLRSENEALRRSLSQAKSEIEKYRTNIKKLQDYIHESAEEISSHHDRLQKEYRLASSELVDTRMRLDNETKAAQDLQVELKRKSGELEQVSARYERLFNDSQTREQDLLQRIEDIRKTANEAADKLDKAEWEFHRKAEAQAREIAVLADVRSNLENQWAQSKRDATEAREHWEQARRDASRLEQEAQASAQREDALRRETDEARAAIAALEKESVALKADLEKEARRQAELTTAGKKASEGFQEQIGQLNQALREAQDALRKSAADAEAQQAATRSLRERFAAREAQSRSERDALAQERDAGKILLQEKEQNIEAARKTLAQKESELAEARAKCASMSETFSDKEKSYKATIEEQVRSVSALAGERDMLAKKLGGETQARQKAETENERLTSALGEERDRKGRAEEEREALRAALGKENERADGLAKRTTEQADAIVRHEARIGDLTEASNLARAQLSEADGRIRELQGQLKDARTRLDEGRETLERERAESAASAERLQAEIQETESRLGEALKEIERQNMVVDNERTARRRCEEESHRVAEDMRGKALALKAELEKAGQDNEQQRVIQENEIELLGIKLEDARQRSDHYKQEFEAASARVEQHKKFYAEEREQRRRVETELMQTKNSGQDLQFQFRKKEREFVLERERLEGDLYRQRQKAQALLKRLESMREKARNPDPVSAAGSDVSGEPDASKEK